MRISDWSSDVCSSDLTGGAPAREAAAEGWQPFDRGRIPRLVAEGRVVFVDVTADWCVTCQVNKARVPEDTAVAAALAEPGVVGMRVDWANPRPEERSVGEEGVRTGRDRRATYN